MKFVYADGEKLGVYRDGKTEIFDSAFIARYRETAVNSAKSKEWKTDGQAARLMAEGYYVYGDESKIDATIRGVSLTKDDNRIVYAFSVNDTSGIYSKFLDDETKTEAHIVSARDVDFMSVFCTAQGGMLAAVQTNPFNAGIALFMNDTGDYKMVTGGDSLDENPSYEAEGKSILFNSYGVGRDANNAFVKYMPSEIYRLDLATLDVESLASDPDYSYIKPLAAPDGNIYCIKKPGKEKTGGNPLLEILLIPVRIFQAIAGFISAFVMCFSGRSMVSGQSGRQALDDGSATKDGKPNAGKIFVQNNLINVDKELKKNKKQEDYGFIPSSWKLVRLAKDGKSEESIASGVGDFCFAEENGQTMFVYTNGRHIFAVGGDGKRRKLADTELCLKVGGLGDAASAGTADFFR